MKKNPTMDMVAKKVGVSRATVSRVISNKPVVDEKTRRKVLEAIEELGFVPNRIAQILTGQSTKTIGVLLENTTNPFYGKILNGIEATLKKHGYLMVLGNSEYIHKEKINIIKHYKQYRVDGIIATLMGYDDKDDEEILNLLEDIKIPFVLINSIVDTKGIPYIVGDGMEGGYIVADHLIKLGHKKILYFTFNSIKGIRIKYGGFKKALKENGLNLKDQIIIDGIVRKSEGYNAMNDFIEQQGIDKIPSAIIATNDIVAVGVMKALVEHNIKIPEEVSVVGYDDIEMADFLQIPLTTIHQSQYEEGEIAAAEIINRIEKGRFLNNGKCYLLKPELVIRESTAPFKKRR